MEELLRTPGADARNQILEYLFQMHKYLPQSFTEETVNRWVDVFEDEENVENTDPISVNDAIARARQDVDTLFSKIASKDVKEYIFSPIPQPDAKRRPTHEELACQWMSRWIRKRKVPEWGRVVGFAGEYLVPSSKICRNSLTGFPAFSSAYYGFRRRNKLD